MKMLLNVETPNLHVFKLHVQKIGVQFFIFSNGLTRSNLWSKLYIQNPYHPKPIYKD